MRSFLSKHGFFLLLSTLFVSVLLFKMGTVSPTFDERNDLGIINCLLEKGNPYQCTVDISQTRLPYYLHAVFAKFFGPSIHYWLSLSFSFLSLLLSYLFARKHFGQQVAIICCVLFISSIPILTSGRMLLTHSNSIFMHVSLWSFFSFYEFVKTKKAGYFIFTAILWGLSMACSVLAVLNALYFLVFYLIEIKRLRFKAYYLIFPFLGILVFFAATIIYTKGIYWDAFWRDIWHGHDYEHWNYFNLDTNEAPFWFSLLIFCVKVHPLLALLFFLFPLIYKKIAKESNRRFFLSIYLFVWLNLILKSGVFHYDAPHHQVHFYPLVYLLLAFGLQQIYTQIPWKKITIIAAAALVLLQGVSIYRFFPNYLFYGAQYGEAYIGEFYGPAVVHAQDSDELNKTLDEILEKSPNVLIAYYEKGLIKRKGKNFINFAHLKPQHKVDYVLIDYVSSHHLRSNNKEAFREFALENCESYYSYDFPRKKGLYQIRKCRN